MKKICLLILAILLARLLPHPFNFSPVMSLCLLAGMFIQNRSLSILTTLSALAISDCILGLYPALVCTYCIYTFIMFFNYTILKHLKLSSLLLAGFLSEIFFFVSTNFISWLSMPMYEKTLNGLMTCYIAAVPFFQHALLGTTSFITLFYIGYNLWIPAYAGMTKEQQ